MDKGQKQSSGPYSEKSAVTEDYYQRLIGKGFAAGSPSKEEPTKHKEISAPKGKGDKERPKVQPVDSVMVKKFEMVGPGLFTFKFEENSPSQKNRIDMSAWNTDYFRKSALPTSIDGFHKTGETRDGLPVYTFG
ncbi:MAG: hypothetical protein K6U74_06130 [Firmicutes bacterium]|nr:hypothetical protein [Bacillota bacterium]